MPIAILGVLEGAIALLIVSQASRESAAAVHVHHPAPDSVPDSGAILWGAAGAIVVTVLVAIVGLRLARRRHDPRALAGFLAAVVAAAVAGSEAAGSSHALMMVVVELALVISPVLIVGMRLNVAPADDVWTVVRAAVSLVTSGAATFLLVTLHLPATHDWYLSEAGLAWWLTPVLLMSGLAFWSSVARFRLPATWRAMMLVAVLETGAIIGLVLLLAGDRLIPMATGDGLGVLADQRLAGGLMMLVDLALLARVVEAALRPEVRPAPGSSSLLVRTAQE